MVIILKNGQNKSEIDKYVLKAFGRFSKVVTEYKYENKESVRKAFNMVDMKLFTKIEVWRFPNTLIITKYEDF